MGIPKLLVAWVAISIALVGVWAEDEVEIGRAPDSSTNIELERLRAEISALGRSIAERTEELKTKDEAIAKLESTIQAKSQRIGSLQDEIGTIQKKGALDAEEKAGKAYARASELEKQEELMRLQLEATSKSKELREAHGAWLPPWLATYISYSQELASTHWNKHAKPALDIFLQKVKKWAEPQLETAKTKWIPVVKEQWLVFITTAESYVHTASLKAVEIYEGSKNAIAPHVVKVQDFADPYFQAHGAWLPPWLATYISYSQELASTHWNKHAKPALDIFLQKVKSIQVKKWAEPQLETAKTKWIPVVKEQWLVFITTAEPYVHTASLKAVEIYEGSKNAIAPHVVKVQDFADPYFQEAKKLTKPYTDQVAKFAKPHVEKVRIVAKPYTEQAVRGYRKFLKSANIYHRLVQETCLDHLEKHEITKPLATKELVWFMASALLASPVFIVYKLLTDIFWSKKGRKRTQNANTNHAHRRHKRRHGEK